MVNSSRREHIDKHSDWNNHSDGGKYIDYNDTSGHYDWIDHSVNDYIDHSDNYYDENPIERDEYRLLDEETLKDIVYEEKQKNNTLNDHIATPFIVDGSREVLNVTVCGDVGTKDDDVNLEESRTVLRLN